MFVYVWWYTFRKYIRVDFRNCIGLECSSACFNVFFFCEADNFLFIHFACKRLLCNININCH